MTILLVLPRYGDLRFVYGRQEGLHRLRLRHTCYLRNVLILLIGLPVAVYSVFVVIDNQQIAVSHGVSQVGILATAVTITGVAEKTATAYPRRP